MKLLTIEEHRACERYEIDIDKLIEENPYYGTFRIDDYTACNLSESEVHVYEFVNRTIPAKKIIKMLNTPKTNKGVLNFNWGDSWIKIVYKNNNEGETSLSEIEKILISMGWFVAKEPKPEQSRMTRYYERNYSDVNLLNNIEHLYHITPDVYLDRIKRYGLIPKDTEKLSKHPNRIYLFLPLKNINDWIYIAKMLYDRTISNTTKSGFNLKAQIEKYYLLKIDISELKNKITFYKDDNFTLGNGAIWTNANIPPKYIEVSNFIDKEEFEL